LIKKLIKCSTYTSHATRNPYISHERSEEETKGRTDNRKDARGVASDRAGAAAVAGCRAGAGAGAVAGAVGTGAVGGPAHVRVDLVLRESGVPGSEDAIARVDGKYHAGLAVVRAVRLRAVEPDRVGVVYGHGEVGRDEACDVVGRAEARVNGTVERARVLERRLRH
jgi:hypothetical protein